MKNITTIAAPLLYLAILCYATTAPALAQNGLMELPDSAHMDIYKAGGYDDGSDGTAPAAYSFSARSGRILFFPRVTGEWTCSNPYPPFGPDGTTSGLCDGQSIMSPLGTFSGYNLTDFAGAMVGVFLENSLPGYARSPLRFYQSNPVEGGYSSDFRTLIPRIGQVFFIGDGSTGTGSVQRFVVPPTATHLYPGFVDSCTSAEDTVPGCFSDNAGTLLAVCQIR
jgi:hypothetical protein